MPTDRPQFVREEYGKPRFVYEGFDLTQLQVPARQEAFPEMYGETPMQSLARTYVAKALDWLEKRESYKEGKPISGENVLKSALTLIAYANPVTGSPMFLGNIVQDPLGAPAGFIDMIKQGVKQLSPIIDILTASPYSMPGIHRPLMSEEQKKIWYEHPETGFFTLGIAAGGLGILGKGVGRVGRAAEAGFKAYTGEAFGISPVMRYRSITQKMREGIKLTREETKIIRNESEAIDIVMREEAEAGLKKEIRDAKEGLRIETPEFSDMPLAEVSLRKDDIALMRDWMRVERFPEPQAIAFLKALEESKIQNLSKDAINIARRSLDESRDISPNEQAALLLRYTEMSHRLREHYIKFDELIELNNPEAAALEKLRAEFLINEMSTIQLASRARGTITSRYMSFLRMKLGEDYSLISLTKKAERAKGKKLTFEESKNYDEYARKIEELEAEIKRMETAEAKWLEEAEKKIAQKVLNIENKKKSIKEKTKAKTKASSNVLEDIENQLRQLGVRVNDITGLSTEALYLIGKYAHEYVKRGITKLDELVATLKTKFPEITDQDVYRALNTKNPKHIKKVTTELQKNWDSIKRQGRILDEMIDISEGKFKRPKTRKTPEEPILSLDKMLSKLRHEAYESGINPLKLENIVMRINSLKDQLANDWREIKKTRKKVEKTQKLKAYEEELKSLKEDLKIEDEIADLKYQLETGNFREPVVRPVRKMSPEKMRKMVELKRLQTEVRAAIEAQRPKSAYSYLLGSTNFLRTIKATADLSAYFRQGFLLVFSRPIKFGKAVARSLQATFSQYKAEEIDMALRIVPHHYLREAAKLDLPEMGIGKINAREEIFASNAIKRLPTLPGKIVSGIINASERNYVTFLNLMRAAAFDELLAKFPNATIKEMKVWANWINVCSGRGNFSSMPDAARHLSLVLFAPKFAVSRIQVPYYFIKYLREPRIRKMVMKDIGSVASVFMTTSILAEMAGAQVGTDPRDADFLKIRFGNVRVDIGAGMQQPIRLSARIILGITDRAGLTGKYLTKSQKMFDPLEAIMRYSMYKFSPSITIPAELYRRKTMVGEKTTALKTIANVFVPFAYQDLRDAYREGGLKLTSLVTGISVPGTNIAIYEDSETTTRIKIRKAMYRGDIDTAKRIRWEWNIKHPDQIITYEYLSKSKIKKGKTLLSTGR